MSVPAGSFAHMGMVMEVVTVGEWVGIAYSLGANQNQGGSSSTQISMDVNIPINTLIFVMTSCGTNTAGDTTLTCTNCTFTSISAFDNNTPNPDRRNTLFVGVSGSSGIGTTLTATFPASTSERMICACYVEGAPITNDGLDAFVPVADGGFASDHNNSWSMTQTPDTDHGQLGFAWISGTSSSGVPIIGTGAAQVLDFSPQADQYSLGIVAWNNQTNPAMSAGALSGGSACVIELTGSLANVITPFATPTLLTQGSASSATNPKTTASISPTADALVLVFLHYSEFSTPPTISGCGITWTNLNGSSILMRDTTPDSGDRYSTCWWGKSASPSSGSISFTNAGTNCIWQVIEIPDAEIVQSKTEGPASTPFEASFTSPFAAEDNIALGVWTGFNDSVENEATMTTIYDSELVASPVLGNMHSVYRGGWIPLIGFDAEFSGVTECSIYILEIGPA